MGKKLLSSKRIERVAEYNNIPVGVCEFYKKEFEDFLSMENLITAFEKTASHGRYKDSVINYMDDFLIRLSLLQTKALAGEYEMGQLSVFNVLKREKQRLIRAVSFEDRILDHVWCDHLLTENFTRTFINENGACIKGRGTNYCMEILRHDMSKMYSMHRDNYYVLQMDIKSFFDTINHAYMKKVIKKQVKNPYIREYITNTIDAFKGEIGLGLGSQITQLLALMCLNDMDHMIKEELQCEFYCRYMDDFIILHEDRDYLVHCLARIDEHLASIGLRLSTKKTKLFKVSAQPIVFLGFKYWHANTGKVLTECRQETIKRAKRKLKKLARLYHEGEIPLSAAMQCYSAYKGHIFKGNVKSQIKGLDKYFTEQFGVSPRRKIIRHYKWKKVPYPGKYKLKWKWKKFVYLDYEIKPLYK